MATIGSNRRFNFESKGPSFPSVAFLWPALAAEQASEFAAAIAKEFAKLGLRDFSTSLDGVATLVCAPFALHGATIADFAGWSIPVRHQAAAAPNLRRNDVTLELETVRCGRTPIGHQDPL